MSARFPFAIVVDGTTVLPEAMRREADMRTLPLHVSFGAESYTSGVDLTTEQFYERIKDSKVRPTTSQPSIGECRATYEQAVRDGYQRMLVLTISADLSGTFSVASTTAQQIIGTDIIVTDTRTTAGGIGLIANACARLRREGGSLDQAVALAGRLAQRTQILALVDTLDFLRRSGRISGAQAMFGSLLDLKPLLDVTGGKAQAIDRVRSRDRGLARLEELIASRTPAGARIHASVLHLNAPDRVSRLGEWVQERYHCVEYWSDEGGPVLAAHVGPGTVALCWYPEEDGRR